MTVTTENNIKQYVLYKIKTLRIGFDDNTEVKLDQITNYELNLDKIDTSTIELTNMLGNIELENHFIGNKRNRIIYVYIEAVGVDALTSQEFKVFYDIPCDMIIRRLKIYNCCSNSSYGDMFVELEGIIK